MSRILIKNGRIINPAKDYDGTADILVEEGVIKQTGHVSCEPGPDCRVIDASGCLVLPGLVDMHVHFREPGREDQETILGGAQVAARGGFTSCAPCPIPARRLTVRHWSALSSFRRKRAD
jgi:dihydroorotase